jgi:signal transduction histidine kinase
MKPRLFEPFQTEKPNGVGIGLALARKIARAHGGDLILDDARPAPRTFPGASFVLTLPLLAEEDTERADHPEGRPRASPGDHLDEEQP